MIWLLTAWLGCSGEEEPTKGASDEVLERARAARSAPTPQARSSGSGTRRVKDRWARLASAVRALGGGEVAEQVEALLEERETRRAADELKLERSLAAVERAFVQACTGEQVDRAFLDFQSDQAAVLQQDRQDLDLILELSGDQGRELIWSIAHPETTFAAGRREAAEQDPPQLGEDTSPPMVRLRLEVQVSVLDGEGLIEAFEARILEQDPSKPRSARRSLEALRELDQALLAHQGHRYLLLQEACQELEPGIWLDFVEQGHVSEALGIFPVPADEGAAAGPVRSGGESPSLARMKRDPGKKKDR